MKGCEPRDLLDRSTDICLFEGQPLELTPQVLDIAWRNYFGTSHSFDNNGESSYRRADQVDLQSPADTEGRGSARLDRP
jgi:hypothetical protein